MSDADHAAFVEDFSAYFERTLPEARTRELAAHLEGCERCRAEYDRFRETMRSLSGLHKLAAPAGFERQVARTIHRRSQGRFFGRKAFGDRVPFELLAVLGLALMLAVYLLVLWSSTGAVHEPLKKPPRAAPVSPELRRVLAPP